MRKTWRRLKGTPHNRSEHIIVNVGSGRRYLHQLVMEAFKGPCPPGMEVCHENGIATDNRLSNLRHKTHGDNMRDKQKHGTESRGESRPMAKLTAAIVIEARKLFAAGETRDRLAAKYKVSGPTITKAINGKTWKHV